MIIPAYNNLHHLIPCLKSLVFTARTEGVSGRIEILVQDDKSPDFDLREILGPPASVERNEKNLGFAGNCNAGARRSRGDVLLFLNQDTKAQPGWFPALMAMFDDPKVGVVGGKMVFANKDAGEIDSIQSCGGWYDGGKGPFHRYLGWAADDWRVNQRERVSWTTGGCLAIRRELFGAVNGFDEGYLRGYFEDTDICEAVKALGFEIWYCPEAVFSHHAGASGGIPGEIFRANSLKFHQKWDKRITPDTAAIHVNY